MINVHPSAVWICGPYRFTSTEVGYRRNHNYLYKIQETLHPAQRNETEAEIWYQNQKCPKKQVVRSQGSVFLFQDVGSFSTCLLSRFKTWYIWEQLNIYFSNLIKKKKLTVTTENQVKYLHRWRYLFVWILKPLPTVTFVDYQQSYSNWCSGEFRPWGTAGTLSVRCTVKQWFSYNGLFLNSSYYEGRCKYHKPRDELKSS